MKASAALPPPRAHVEGLAPCADQPRTRTSAISCSVNDVPRAASFSSDPPASGRPKRASWSQCLPGRPAETISGRLRRGIDAHHDDLLTRGLHEGGTRTGTKRHDQDPGALSRGSTFDAHPARRSGPDPTGPRRGSRSTAGNCRDRVREGHPWLPAPPQAPPARVTPSCPSAGGGGFSLPTVVAPIADAQIEAALLCSPATGRPAPTYSPASWKQPAARLSTCPSSDAAPGAACSGTSVDSSCAEPATLCTTR